VTDSQLALRDYLEHNYSSLMQDLLNIYSDVQMIVQCIKARYNIDIQIDV
jgi:hypothetical protein